MKNILLSAILIIFAVSSPAQNDEKTRKVEILPQSSISIHGDVKITDFTCQFDVSHLQSPVKISYKTDRSEILFSEAELVLKNKGFDCGNRSRNRDFHSMVKTEQYPEMRLKLLEATPNNKGKTTVVARIYIAGKENTYSIPVSIKKISDSVSELQGTFDINIRDFDLEPIKKMFGLIKVQDIIQINLNLHVEMEEKE